jgi:hypothetical protein
MADALYIVTGVLIFVLWITTVSIFLLLVNDDHFKTQVTIINTTNDQNKVIEE